MIGTTLFLLSVAFSCFKASDAIAARKPRFLLRESPRRVRGTVSDEALAVLFFAVPLILLVGFIVVYIPIHFIVKYW